MTAGLAATPGDVKAGADTPKTEAILLTGRPGIGKSTIIQQVVARLGGRAAGFFTREVRQKGRRTGFEIVTLDGQRGTLATTLPHRVSNPHPFGRYTVDLDAIDHLAVPALLSASQGDRLVLVDEIGPMEIASDRFRAAVWQLLESDTPLLGTVVKRPYRFADEVKHHPRVILVEVTLANREDLPQQLATRLRNALSA